jgi:hypothetical protein
MVKSPYLRMFEVIIRRWRKAATPGRCGNTRPNMVTTTDRSGPVAAQVRAV